MSGFPEMSVVMITPDRYASIRKSIGHLRAQTLRNRLEVLIVAPSADRLGLDESELRDFHQFRVIEVGTIRSTAGAIAAGVRQASAPVVAYVEEHSYPEPGWAEALIKAHRQPWAAVGVVIRNANPESMISWAHLFTDFAPWLEPVSAGMMQQLAPYHASYKRGILLDYGPELECMLNDEAILHWDLQARGHRLYLEPNAKEHHLNHSSLFPYLQEQFYGGRMFGAERARHGRWSVIRRLVYIAGLPLIPMVRLWRILREIRRSDRHRRLLPSVLPVMILGVIVHAIGEVMGYAIGAGRAAERMVSLDLSRYRYVGDRGWQPGPRISSG
jgi:hypothetical protein